MVNVHNFTGSNGVVFMCNKVKYVRAAIALQEPSRLLQHLFYFISLHIKPDL